MPSQLNLILLGPPGAGKGTQAVRLQHDLHNPLISTGVTLRTHVSDRTALGLAAQVHMDAGELVPDDLIVAMVSERLEHPDTADGIILDGFPRTTAQADALGEKLAALRRQIHAAILIDAPDNEIVKRIGGRLICSAAGHSYHRDFAPPQRSDICDHDGSPLFQRDDDKPEVVRSRLQVYHQQTAPLIGYYRSRGLLCTIDGTQAPDNVYDSIRAVIATFAPDGSPRTGCTS